MGYVASMRLKPVTDGDRTFWEWRSDSARRAHRRDELSALVTRRYLPGRFRGDRRRASARPEAPASPPIAGAQLPLRRPRRGIADSTQFAPQRPVDASRVR